MTCIVGVQHNGAVIIGGDSAGSSNGIRVHRADPKVYRNGDYAIGFTTSFRMGQLLRYADLPKPLDRTGDDLDRFMVIDFVNTIRQTLKDGGWAEKDKEQEKGGTFLVGVNGVLYEINSDYQIGRTIDGYAAVGSGWELALGSLHTTRDLDLEPVKRIGMALEAAAHHCGSVHPPFNVALVGER